MVIANTDRTLNVFLPRFYLDFAAGLCCLYLLGVVLRAYGRCGNSVYAEFAQHLVRARKDPTSDAKVSRTNSFCSRCSNHTELQDLLRRYDFEFWAWPADFVNKDPRFDYILHTVALGVIHRYHFAVNPSSSWANSPR